MLVLLCKYLTLGYFCYRCKHWDNNWYLPLKNYLDSPLNATNHHKEVQYLSTAIKEKVTRIQFFINLKFKYMNLKESECGWKDDTIKVILQNLNRTQIRRSNNFIVYLVLVYNTNHEHQTNGIKTVRENHVHVFVNY